MAKRGLTVLLGGLVVAGCGAAPMSAPGVATAEALSTKSFWGWRGNGGSVPTSGVDSYLRQGRGSQVGWSGYGPLNWNQYYPGWGGPSPYYLPPVYKTDFGNFSYFAFPFGF